MFRTFAVAISLFSLIACNSRQGSSISGEPGSDPLTAGQTESRSSKSRAEPRFVTLAAGTILPLTLETSVASDTSHVEDRIEARVSEAVLADNAGQTEVIPRGSRVEGYVSAVEESGKVKGRARIALTFNTLVVDDTRYPVATVGVTRQAPATKKQDAEKIAIPAAGGAVIGAIVGGKKGAAIGAAVGGGGGTAYVLSTSGKEVRLGKGASVSVRLTEPVTVRVQG